MKKKLIKKIKIIIIMIIILLNSILSLISNGMENEYIHLVKIGNADHHLKYYREATGLYTYLQCSIVGYYQNNQFYPAYCMNRDLPGAETAEYDVQISDTITNNQVWRIVKNGYPYKSYGEMGLASEYDAFCVTKMAIYCVLGQANIDYFSVDENDEIGKNMLNTLRELVRIATEEGENQKSNYLNLKKVGELRQEERFYTQEYTITSSIPSKDYEIHINNHQEILIERINQNNFKIKIPKHMISRNIEIIFDIDTQVENFPILYGQTTVAGMQNYVITAEKYTSIKENFKSNIQTNRSRIELIKKDKENGKFIPNTKFELMDENKNVIQTKVTDQQGRIIFAGLFKGRYFVKETESNKDYILNIKEAETMIELEYNENKKIEIGNEHKKGNMKLVKFDKDNPKITLGGIEFKLYDENHTFIEKYTTDLNGEIKIDNLNIGKYYLEEVNAKNGYEIVENVEFEIRYNETTQIEIGNEKTKGKVKVIKVDKENQDIKISGVKFIILDENKNVVDQLITDENGEAISKDLPIYLETYYLKEIETKEEYILDDNEIMINLNPNIIDTKIITNEIKKGKIKILKLDYDTFKPLKGVKFDVINLTTGECIEQIQTNEKGEAITSNLPINCEYKIIEIETLDGYKINEDEMIVRPKWNKEISVTITNEKEKGRIKIIKVDKEDPAIKLSGVKFELYNGENLLEVLETDEKGEVYSKWLYSYNEKYYLIEIEGKQGYKLGKDKIEFELIANKTIDLMIENEQEEIVEQPEEETPEIVEVKKLPKTGY